LASDLAKKPKAFYDAPGCAGCEQHKHDEE